MTKVQTPQVLLHEDIFPLYHLNYYDGPLSGVCVYQGKECFFDKIDDQRQRYDYKIFETSEKEIKYINMWHRIFQLNVGLHSDYFFDIERNRYSRTPGVYVTGTTKETSSSFFAFSKQTRNKFPEKFPEKTCIAECSYDVMFIGKGKEDKWPSGKIKVHWETGT